VDGNMSQTETRSAAYSGLAHGPIMFIGEAASTMRAAHGPRAVRFYQFLSGPVRIFRCPFFFLDGKIQPTRMHGYLSSHPVYTCMEEKESRFTSLRARSGPAGDDDLFNTDALPYFRGFWTTCMQWRRRSSRQR